MATFLDNRRRHNWKRFNSQMNNAYQFRRSSPYLDPYSQNPLVFCVILDTSRNITKHKSASQKRRDEQRRELFNSRKSVCVSMPFSDLSNNDLAKVMPKHFPCKRDTDMIRASNLDPKSSKINKLTSDLEQTQTTIVRLENTLAEERKSLRIAEEQAVLSTEQITKLRAEVNMATALKEMREETIEEIKTNNSSLKQQLDASLRECHGLTLESEHKLKLQNQEIIQKLIRIQELEKQLHDKDSSLNCTKCGESECSPNNCAALFNICKNCSKRGHFTKLCNFICATCGDVEFHRREHCRAVAYSSKCQACGIQGHFQGTKACPGKGSYCARRGRRR